MGVCVFVHRAGRLPRGLDKLARWMHLWVRNRVEMSCSKSDIACRVLIKYLLHARAAWMRIWKQLGRALVVHGGVLDVSGSSFRESK